VTDIVIRLSCRRGLEPGATCTAAPRPRTSASAASACRGQDAGEVRAVLHSNAEGVYTSLLCSSLFRSPVALYTRPCRPESHVCSDALSSLPVLETLELTAPNVETVLDEVRCLLDSCTRCWLAWGRVCMCSYAAG
jgi:hypothetical protein